MNVHARGGSIPISEEEINNLKFEETQMENTKDNVLEFYAGAGGRSVSREKEGFRVIHHVDTDTVVYATTRRQLSGQRNVSMKAVTFILHFVLLLLRITKIQRDETVSPP